jgi:hypothetical protein
MNALERLGLQVCAERLLGNRGTAIILMALINANGKPVKYTSPARIASRKVPYPDTPSEGSFRTRVCWVRSALRDIGFDGAIKTTPGPSYSLSEPFRTEIINRLMEEAR